MKNKIKNIFKNIIYSKNKISELEKKLNLLQKKLEENKTWVNPGHFYSPIPSFDEIKKKEDEIFSDDKKVESIDINDNKQLDIFNKIVEFYPQLPFFDDKSENLLYYYRNSAFSYADAISLYSMLRIFKPKRVIEVGSGHSSCVTLDTNRLFLNNSVNITFIEPYPQLLNNLTEEIGKKLNIIDSNLQEVSLDIFKQLNDGDILFIDSTHVSKTGSDVNYIFFEILPVLKSGVIIHFHDIFYPFEYPKGWVYEGRSWNEDYILRAFLEYNNSFEIIFFNNYMFKKHKDLLEKETPLYLKNPGGSIWLRKK